MRAVNWTLVFYLLLPVPVQADDLWLWDRLGLPIAWSVCKSGAAKAECARNKVTFEGWMKNAVDRDLNGLRLVASVYGPNLGEERGPQDEYACAFNTVILSAKLNGTATSDYRNWIERCTVLDASARSKASELAYRLSASILHPRFDVDTLFPMLYPTRAQQTPKP